MASSQVACLPLRDLQADAVAGVDASLNQPPSDESDSAFKDGVTDNSDWHEVELRPTLIQIIARVTSLIFVDPELNRDPAWLDITVTYFAKSSDALKEHRL
ncbi:cytochrome P450 [Colletotrichum tabaci]|uniref:Cytochrome P450 n=1 Tax=Colletotrichum tabaci TaxID=1209068 RepID=A0AAV9SX77_9PEZI